MRTMALRDFGRSIALRVAGEPQPRFIQGFNFLRSWCVGAAYRQIGVESRGLVQDRSLFSNGEFEGVDDRHFCAAADTQQCAYQCLRKATRYIRHNESL